MTVEEFENERPSLVAEYECTKVLLYIVRLLADLEGGKPMTYEEYLIKRAKLVAKLERAEGLLHRANSNLARSKSEVAREKWTLEVERAQELIELDCKLLNDIGDELVNSVMPFPEH